MDKPEDNIFLKVRRRYPEGAPIEPGSDRDWIYNVWGKTAEADPFNESASRVDVPLELDTEEEPAETEVTEPDPTTLEYELKYPAPKRAEILKVWKPMRPGENLGVADDFAGNKPIEW